MDLVERIRRLLLRHRPTRQKQRSSMPAKQRSSMTVEQLEQMLDEAGQPHTLAGAAVLLGMTEGAASDWLYDKVPDLRETLEVLADPALVQRLDRERGAIPDGAPTFSIDEVRAELARRRGK